MRIIAGKHKSRKLETLEGNNTRPMMDVMKESVFNIVTLFSSFNALTLLLITLTASLLKSII